MARIFIHADRWASKLRNAAQRRYPRLRDPSPKRHVWWIVLTLVALILVLLGSRNTIIEGRVVGVGDGNQLVLVDDEGLQHRIKLAYIEAPELAQARGPQAHKWLADRLLQREVRAEMRGMDGRGALLCRVWAYDIEINHEMLRAGMAWHIKRVEQEQPNKEFVLYQAAESEARRLHTGVWASDYPEAPWIYRELATPPPLRTGRRN